MSTSVRGTPPESPSPVSPDTRPGLRVARSFSRLESIDGNDDPLASSLARLKAEPTIPDSVQEVATHEESEDEDGNPLSFGLLPEDFDDLPPELISLADRFIDSLTKPIHPAPLTVIQLSDMFQQFYGTASQATGKYVSQSFLSLSSKKPRSRTPTTQMLSKAEMVQKKRDRKMLEVKRIALEEAIEKRVTEGVYDKIWRHRSTDDDARDDSLHSKIAALKVVGVNLGHLGVELDSAEKEKEVDDELQAAIKALEAMNEKKYPLGKLSLLKQAHKAIVDCLTNHISTTSADSLLPTLIYTLILSPPEPSLNAISNLYFTQRFRASNFIDGEAAYCLTNFEAAISFLETVDLATLKISDTDGASSGSPLVAPQTPVHVGMPAGDPLSNLAEKLTKAHSMTERIHAMGKNASANSSTASLLQPGVPRGKGLSYLTPIDLATTAVSTADQSIRGIGVALENSYKFLFDRRGENVPKTLEDARKLVESPNSPAIGALRGDDSGSEQDEKPPSAIREPSPAPPPTPPRSSTAGLDPLKHIGSSIGRFANIGMRGFARSTTPSASTPPTALVETKRDTGIKDLLQTFPDLAKEVSGEARLEHKANNRFLEVADVGELRIAEVAELLREYRGLVDELRKRGLVG